MVSSTGGKWTDAKKIMMHFDATNSGQWCQRFFFTYFSILVNYCLLLCLNLTEFTIEK